MKSDKYNQSSRSTGAILFCLAQMITMSACAQNVLESPLRVSIIQGRQFARQLRFPRKFLVPSSSRLEPPHYVFRVEAAAPDVLLLAACRYDNPSMQPRGQIEVCSTNFFAVDTAHSYAIAEKGVRDWEQALPIAGARPMFGGSPRNLREDEERPLALRPKPIGREIEREGYEFNGKAYMRRAKWNTALSFDVSADNRLIVLAGYDRNILSHGPFTLDVFDGDPDRRIVAIDAESSAPIEDRLRQVSIVNSRWLVMALNLVSRTCCSSSSSAQTGRPSNETNLHICCYCCFASVLELTPRVQAQSASSQSVSVPAQRTHVQLLAVPASSAATYLNVTVDASTSGGIWAVKHMSNKEAILYDAPKP